MIAILYTGLPRLIKENINSIKQLNRLKNTKLFFALWEESENINETINLLKLNFKNVYVKKIKARPFLWKDKLDESKFKGEDFLITLLQYDALQQGFNFANSILKDDASKYLWCRSRSDIFIRNVPSFVLNNCDLEIPSIHYGTGYCDYFAIGNYEGMLNYCNHINTITRLIDLKIYLPAEISLALHLDLNKVKVRINRRLPKILINNTKFGLKKRYFYWRENYQKLTSHPGQNIVFNSKEESYLFSIFRLFNALPIDLIWFFVFSLNWLKFHIKNSFKKLKIKLRYIKFK